MLAIIPHCRGTLCVLTTTTSMRKFRKFNHKVSQCELGISAFNVCFIFQKYLSNLRGCLTFCAPSLVWTNDVVVLSDLSN